MRSWINGNVQEWPRPYSSKKVVRAKEVGQRSLLDTFYIDNGRSILRFFFLASRTCFVIFMHKSNSTVTQTNTKASWMCLKYKETTEKTKNAKITSSHITKTTTSTLHHNKRVNVKHQYASYYVFQKH